MHTQVVSRKTARSSPERGTPWTTSEALDPTGFQRIEAVPRSSYRDTSTVVLVPSRDQWMHTRFVQHMNSIQWAMNMKRALFHITGDEVGKAYSDQIKLVLEHPELSKWKYVMTIEDDVLVPPDCFIRLAEAIEAGPFGGVSGLYFTKSDDLPMPMCYGDPAEYARTGVADFRPRDVREAVKQGAIVPCNGIACGISLYRMSLFRDLPYPWFVTSPSHTQDLYLCGNAIRAGKRFAVDCGVRCGHLDFESGRVF